MRIDIVVVYVRRYARGHERDFVPSITGIHLAALTPPGHEVRVRHQQVETIDPATCDADLVALSFFSGFAAEAYRLADAYRARGVRVVLGGPHATFWPDEALAHADAVVTGEAESVWPELVADIAAGRLGARYDGRAQPLAGLPTPRYDLLPARYLVRRVVQATRGCPFTCSFCTVPTLNPGFRVRPVAEVLRDVAYDRFPRWWQRKLVWFWDDNLTANRAWVKDLLRAMIPYQRWWLTQASIDIVKDEELLALMQRSGCIGIFLGIESFDAGSLRDAKKRQNHVEAYRAATDALHARGITVMAGFIAGFDHDTPESVRAMADLLEEAGIDVPFLSVLTPYRGTPLHAEMERDGRILEDRGWESYNGYNVTFRPARMTPDELLAAHRALWRKAFSLPRVLGRIFRGTRRLRLGAFLLSAAMNAFYGLKAATGNEPIDMSTAEGIARAPVASGDAPAPTSRKRPMTSALSMRPASSAPARGTATVTARVAMGALLAFALTHASAGGDARGVSEPHPPTDAAETCRARCAAGATPPEENAPFLWDMAAYFYALELEKAWTSAQPRTRLELETMLHLYTTREICPCESMWGRWGEALEPGQHMTQYRLLGAAPLDVVYDEHDQIQNIWTSYE